MKSSDKPEISKKWWSSEKPGDVKGTELEKALASAEKAMAEEKKRGDESSIGACLTALSDLSAAVDKTLKKELDKKKHKDPIAVLGKFDALIGGEVKRLEAAQAKLGGGDGEEDEEGEEISDDKLFEKDYLYKMVKMMKNSGKELNFSFAVNPKEPEGCCLLLHRKGKPERLYKALKKTGQFSNRQLTCGVAMADPDDGKTLVFRLGEDAAEPPQIQKLGRKFLRGDKNLKFRKLKLVLASGDVLEDTEPDEEPTAESASAPVTAAGGRRLSPEERERIRKEIERIELRLNELMAEQEVSA